jgi:DHA1 family multidrug resistance protein-like MFS transporter
MIPYYRKNLYILSITIFLAALSWNQVIPFLPKYLESLGVHDNIDWWVGIVFALQSGASIICMPLWGKLGDAHGRKPMIIRAGFFLAAIYVAMVFCQQAWHLAVCRFLNGALTGFVPSSFALIATNTPSDKAPKSVATLQMASSAGFILGPAFGGVLADLWGYRGSMWLSGCFILLSTLAVWFFVEEPNKVNPEENKTRLWEDFAIAMRNRFQRAMLFATFICWAFGASIAPYLALYIPTLGHNIPTWLVGVVISLPSLALLLTARIWIKTGERNGYGKVMVTGLIGSGLSAVFLFFARSFWSFALVYFCAGIFLAAIPPAVGALTCLKIDPGFRGRAYGLENSFGTMSAMIAPLMASTISSLFGRSAIFPFAGIVCLIGSFLLWKQVHQWDS